MSIQKLRVQLNSAMEDLSEERLVVDEMRSELETLLADRDALEQRLEDLEARRVAEQEDSQAIIAGVCLLLLSPNFCLHTCTVFFLALL